MVQWLDSKWCIGEVGPVGADVVVDNLLDVCVVTDHPATLRAKEEDLTTGVAVAAIW